MTISIQKSDNFCVDINESRMGLVGTYKLKSHIHKCLVLQSVSTIKSSPQNKEDELLQRF